MASTPTTARAIGKRPQRTDGSACWRGSTPTALVLDEPLRAPVVSGLSEPRLDSALVLLHPGSRRFLRGFVLTVDRVVHRFDRVHAQVHAAQDAQRRLGRTLDPGPACDQGPLIGLP